VAPQPKNVKLSPPAAKAARNLSPELQEPLKTALHALALDPLMGKALKGELHGLRRYRVRDYRIVYYFDAETVTVVSIAHRREVYR
jgi:mRNA interferase RelE/StbE